MRKQNILLICLTCLTLSVFFNMANAQNSKASQRTTLEANNNSLEKVIDWQKFMSRNDMVWTKLPNNWNNAPFVGNGCLGSIFWMNKKGTLNMEVSRGDLYDHRNLYKGTSSSLFSRYRLPNGHFELSFGNTSEGTMHLDLWNAEAKGHITSGSNAWDIRCFTHAKTNVIVFELVGAAVPKLVWVPDSAKSTRSKPPQDLKPYPFQVLKDFGGINVSVQDMPEDTAYNNIGQGIGQFATAWTSVNMGNNHTVYYISMGYSYPGATAENEAIRLINQAKKDGLPALEKSHREWWHTYYPKSFMSVPDAAIESFYWIQMYKMASASRQGGPIMDLMGPWFLTTGWPAIWWNLNIQLAYWPFYMSNHLAEAEPLAETLWKNRGSLAKNAAPYDNDSYAIGRATGPECDWVVGTEVGNLPWVMHNLWLYYRSSMDDRFLSDRLFPLMKGSFRYLRHIVVQQPDGTYSLPKTASPEYTDGVENCNYTLACLRWLASTLIIADTRLKAKDPITTDCRDLLAKLVPYQTDDSTGFLVGKNMPFVNSHRHWSHLFMIYPFYEYTWDNPAQAPLIKKSVENWVSKPKGFAGYSWLGAASMLAAGGMGDQSLGYLRTFLAKSPLPNTLYREGSPVIETPLAFARTVQELLMTSHGNLIRIFPGVPSKWSNAIFTDFRAEGAFLVSAQRKDGATRYIRIRSLAGEPCRVNTGMSGTIKVEGKNASIKDLGKGIVEVGIRKGESVLLYTGDVPPTVEISPVAITEQAAPWGEAKPLK